MIDLLNKALGRLVTGLGADAAVVWTAQNDPAGGVVVATYPFRLLPTGTDWPLVDGAASQGFERDPARLSALVPTTLRIELIAPPTAARAFRLGQGNLHLLVVWCAAAPHDDLDASLQNLVDEELSYLANVVEDSRFNRGEVARLRAVVNGLDEAVVSVDTILGQASVNESAAKLLSLAPGKVAASEFARAMARLAGQTVNHGEVAEANMRMQAEPTRPSEQVWRFASDPTHLRVTSIPLQDQGFDGRVWVFTDESKISQALDSSEDARTVLRASADAMLDPLVQVRAVRDADGRIVDFVYRDVNQATCDYLGLDRDTLIGTTLLETMPNVDGSGLLAQYIRCADTGEPVVLDDFYYYNEILRDARRYDIRGARISTDALTLTWRDVTDRFEAAERIAESERQFRLLAENSGDMVTHIRDGRFAWVSPAAEAIYRTPPENLLGKRISDFVPPEARAAHSDRRSIIAAGEPVLTRMQIVDVNGDRHWVHLNARPFYDEQGTPDGAVASLRLIDDEVAAEQQAETARKLQAAADARYRRLMDGSPIAMCLVNTDGTFNTVNQATCDFFGYDADALRTKTWQDLTPNDSLGVDQQNFQDVLDGRIDSYRLTKQYLHADGHRLWGDLSVSCLRDSDGRVETFVSQVIDITAEMQAREQLEESRRKEASSAALYRSWMGSSPVATALSAPDASFIDVNPAACQFFGLDRDTLMGTRWEQLIADGFAEEVYQGIADLSEGRADGIRMIVQYLYADGHLIWGDMSAGCVRSATGDVESFVIQVIDVTAEMEGRRLLAESDESNRALAHGLQVKTEQMTSELNSAAAYVGSILPSGLDGAVEVRSIYLPSQELGGDCFDYNWIDDDHLMVYLVDVSGHGIAPALLSVSVHNMLRSHSMDRDTLLDPALLLNALNDRFQMDRQGGNYFTVWYGVYENSTRTLRYASAGHPPALAFRPGAGTPTSLGTAGMPVGMFDGSEFTSESYVVPADTTILIYSDGAFELTDSAGDTWSHGDFTALSQAQFERAGLDLDVLTGSLHKRAGGSFEDDCSMVLLRAR